MFTLPPLLYKHESLEPHIDGLTMQIHHTKHHQGYIDKLNAALQGNESLFEKTVEELVSEVNTLPQGVQQAVQNHGGGHANHSLFWSILGPDGGEEPQGELAKSINTKFGSFLNFKDEFSSTAGSHFGSGWAWLVVNRAKELEVLSTSNQDSPLMQGKTPILGLDIWEHAYYLHYQNRRPDYIKSFWSVVNWQEVSRRFEEAKS